jgi:hypothetical protein
MGDEKKDYEIWLDEYAKTMGNSSIDLSDYYSTVDDSTYTISLSDGDWIFPQEPKHDDIVLTGGGEEMLRVDKDGFYVRGVKVEADAKEAEQVYKAFKEWLAWAHLSRREEE